jgi:uncharacterized protein
MDDADANDLCLECGLCCNGVIFADGQLQAGDDVGRLQALGLRLLRARHARIKPPKFQQPCSALEGCRCGIYAERPRHCRAFECLLLQGVKAGRLEAGSARRLIRAARGLADRVRRGLRDLGDTDEDLALSRRFRRMNRRLEAGGVDRRTAGLFAELTLAMHELNLLLGEAFYPQPRVKRDRGGV